jgi:hypothetical protein
MKSKILILIVMIIGFGIISERASAQMEPAMPASEEISASEKLVVLWTSGDKEVAEKMVLMYTFNSKRFDWWKDITLVVWGPSQKVLVENKDMQDYVKKIMDQGTAVKACKGCSDMYGISDKLEELGVEVKYMGELTDYIKEGRHVLTL